MPFDGQSRNRWRRLVTKFLASPLLPVLGWTKLVESLIATGPSLAWLAYAITVTVVWIFADDIRDTADIIRDTADEIEATVRRKNE